jgi:hypothetical protein
MTAPKEDIKPEIHGDYRLNVNSKQHWGDIYLSPSPMPYFTTMTPYDYGHYQNRFLEFVCPFLDKHYPDHSQLLEVVEVGSSYGNTTLAYKCGYTWEKTGQIWEDDSLPLEPLRSVNVTAVDMSQAALTYGAKRGIFDEIIVHDFNALISPPTVVTKLPSADLLIMIMISSYIKTLPLQRLVLQFLGFRDKKKILIYNDTCAFDTRNLSPESLFVGIPKWSTQTYFTKHRNFTEEESRLRHNCRESWTYTYFVTFDVLEIDNANVR